MALTIDDLIKIGGGIVGGGAVGALLTNYFTNRRNKVQPVAIAMSVSRITPPTTMHRYSAAITITDNSNSQSESYQFNQLTIIQFDILNNGNKDFEKFSFGVRLPENNKIISFQHEEESKYHKVISENEISLSNPFREVDITLEPFNRKNPYRVSMIIDAVDRDIHRSIVFETAAPVVFIHSSGVNVRIESLISLLVKSVITKF